MDLLAIAYLVVLAAYLLWAVRSHAARRGGGWALKAVLAWALLFGGLALLADGLGWRLP